MGEYTISTAKKTRVNQDIRAREVRLIGAEGEQVGVVSTDDALKQASQASLDLVEISPNSEPPVCRIMDFGKFQFQQSKKKAAAKKKQKLTHIKELKFRPTIEDGDYQVKLRKIITFLEAGDKVKVTLRFRGREVSHNELGINVLKRVKKDVQEYGSADYEPRLEGRQAVMLLVPIKK